MTPQREDIDIMEQAILLARSAADQGEVPVGAIITFDGNIIGDGANCPVTTQDPTAHAEIIALRKAAENHANYRLPGTTLYVTLEPCIMCMGAMIHARVQRVVFGAYDPKTGAAGSCYSIGKDHLLNHQIEITGGICESECASLLKSFFKGRRRQKRFSL